MALGNRIGFRAAEGLTMERLLSPLYGGFIFECEGSVKHAELLGVTGGSTASPWAARRPTC